MGDLSGGQMIRKKTPGPNRYYTFKHKEVPEYKRVVKETIGKNLPDGFQTSEFVLEHGFLDFIVKRKELKSKISLLLDMYIY